MQPLIDQYNIKYKICEETIFVEETKNAISLDKYQLFFTFLNNNPQITILDFSNAESCPDCFQQLKFIESILLPLSCKAMPMFRDCLKLSNIDAKNIEIIGHPNSSRQLKAFNNCPNLLSMKFNRNLQTLNPYSFFGSSLQCIDLRECDNLEIKERAFQWCDSLEKVYLPSHILRLGSYVFLQCSNLEFVFSDSVISICTDTFRGCVSLKEIPFYVDTEQYKIKYKRKFNIDSFFKEYDCYSEKTGIILRCDDQYMYIWSFTDLQFYQTSDIDKKLEGAFITFNHDHSLSPFFKDKKTYFLPANKINKALDIKVINCSSDIGELNMSEPYTIYHRSGICVNASFENNQKQAIAFYIDSLKQKDESILEIIDNIKSKVESLNIKEIINSYQTIVDEHTISKVGGDDRFYSNITRRCSYYDNYLQSLLPDKSSSYRDSGYTSNWPWTSKDEIRKMNEEDNLLRNEAFVKYKKEDHIECLVQSYIDSILNNKIDLEKYCHIESAKMLLNRYINKNSGVELVAIVNKICREYYGEYK